MTTSDGKRGLGGDCDQSSQPRRPRQVRPRGGAIVPRRMDSQHRPYSWARGLCTKRARGRWRTRASVWKRR